MKYASRDGTWFGNVSMKKFGLYGIEIVSETLNDIGAPECEEIMCFKTESDRDAYFEELKKKFMGEG